MSRPTPTDALAFLRARNQAATPAPMPAGPVGTTHLGNGARIGLPLGSKVDVGPIAIADAERSGHLGCFGTTRVGKAQPLDALVHTVKGFRRMGDIRPGDLVSTPDGGEARVLAVFPQGVLPMYRLTFEDGRSVLASGDHLWEIHHTQWRGKYRPGHSRAGQARPRILSTRELDAQMARNKGSFAVRLTQPVSQTKQELPLDPYVLGCLIGDGSIGKGDRVTFCNPDPEIVARIRARLRSDLALRHVGPRSIDYAFVMHPSDRPDTAVRRDRTGRRRHPLKQIVRELGLSGSRSWEKHIPELYQAGAIDDRLELLRGLLDTDGTVTKTGTIQFDTTSERLARDVQTLVWSLGGIATVKRKSSWYKHAGERRPGRLSYHLTIRHPTPRELLTLPRKRDRAPAIHRGGAGSLMLRVTSIEPAGEAEAQCLLLDHPAHLYVTDGYVVTHNTRLVEHIVAQDIRKGYSVLIIDPKGDHELFNRVVQTAVETGRLDEVMLLTPIFPRVSIHVGPLTSYYMQDELVNMLISGVKAKEDYFIAIAQEVSQAIVAGLVALRRADRDPRPLTFLDVKDRIGFKDLVAFAEELARVPGTDDVRRSIQQMIQSPNLADFWAKVSSSFRTTLSALTFGAVGEIMGRATVNAVIERLESGKRVIVVAQTGSLLTQRTSVLVGKMLISMIQALVGRLFSSGRVLAPPLCLHIDEGHNVLYAGFQELINKGGGANCWVHFYTQSLAQIEAEVGPEYARSIVDNINTWLYLLVNHPETAQHIEATSPLRHRYEPVLQMGGDVTIRTVEGPAIRADRVLRLPKRWFYCRSYGKVWKGMTADVADTWLKVRWPVIRPQSVEAGAAETGPS